MSISVPVPSPRERIVLWNEHLGPQHRLKPAEVAAFARNSTLQMGRFGMPCTCLTIQARVVLRSSYRMGAADSLPVPVRPGVRRREEESQSRGRTPRISRLMALAIHFEGLVSDGAVRNYRELAEAGQVSRARLARYCN